MTTEFNTMQTLKRRFFAMRNGVIADTLRKAGAPWRMIFGLNLPQIAEIARDYAPDADLAMRLWADRTTRESALMASMVMPAETMTQEMALEWLRQAPCSEAVDVMCLKLMRRLPFATDIVVELSAPDAPDMERYAALRLVLNLMPAAVDMAQCIARAEQQRQCALTAPLVRQILEEADWIKGQD